MRLLRKYITTSFLATFGVTLLVLTFVMSIGGIFKITELLARGVRWRPVVSLFLWGIPFALAFAVPVSALTGTLLVFGRLSADGEISAMKACGVSMWQIAASPLRWSLALVAVCLYINSDLAPRSHYAQRNAIAQLGMETPFELLEEGRFIQDFEGLTVYVGRRKGAQLSDVRVYDLRQRGIRREVRAKSGVVRSAPNGDLIIDLRDVRVDPFLDDRPGQAFFDRWPIVIPNAMQNRQYRKKPCDFNGGELLARVLWTGRHYRHLDAADLAQQHMVLTVEFHKRIVLAVSCFAFVWLGIPLGTRTQRKESSVGIAISMMLVFNFYLFVIAGESLAKHPAFHAYLIVWMPVAISLALGGYLLRRAN